MRIRHHEWNHVGVGWWLHSQGATIHLARRPIGPIESHVLGQCGVNVYAAEHVCESYDGWRIEFRCNSGTWAYSLDYRATEEGAHHCLWDAGNLGMAGTHKMHGQIMEDIRRLTSPP